MFCNIQCNRFRMCNISDISKLQCGAHTYRHKLSLNFNLICHLVHIHRYLRLHGWFQILIRFQVLILFPCHLAPRDRDKVRVTAWRPPHATNLIFNRAGRPGADYGSICSTPDPRRRAGGPSPAISTMGGCRVTRSTNMCEIGPPLTPLQQQGSTVLRHCFTSSEPRFTIRLEGPMIKPGAV